MDITELCTDLAKTQTYVKQMEDLPAKVALDKLDHAFQQFLKGLNPDRKETNGTDVGSTLPTTVAVMPTPLPTATAPEDVWLTDQQATKWLGITDESVLRLVVRRHGFHYERRDGHMMIPLSELQRMQDNNVVWETRDDDRALEAIGGNYMTPEEMEYLELGRVRRSPWEK